MSRLKRRQQPQHHAPPLMLKLLCSHCGLSLASNLWTMPWVMTISSILKSSPTLQDSKLKIVLKGIQLMSTLMSVTVTVTMTMM
jgi:hypothetical protein